MDFLSVFIQYVRASGSKFRRSGSCRKTLNSIATGKMTTKNTIPRIAGVVILLINKAIRIHIVYTGFKDIGKANAHGPSMIRTAHGQKGYLISKIQGMSTPNKTATIVPVLKPKLRSSRESGFCLTLASIVINPIPIRRAIRHSRAMVAGFSCRARSPQ